MGKSDVRRLLIIMQIKMRNKVTLSILILSLTTLTVQCQKESKVTNRPTNVLFIAIDDLRPNIGAYGDSIAITPNIDKLAKNGVLFNRAYCQMAVCGPSRSSVLTGMYPDQIGVRDLVTHFREKQPDVVTLPQIFKKNGYHSIIIGKIFHGAKKLQDTASISRPSLLAVSSKKEQYVLPKNHTGQKAAATEMAEVVDAAYWDGKIANHAIDALKEFKESGDPFFLSVGFMKSHLPFNAPKKYWEMYDRENTFLLKNRKRPKNAPEIAFHNSQELRGYKDIGTDIIPLEKEKELWNGYYAAISYIDAQLGKVLESLDRLGLKNNTLVVLWSDHGYHLGEQDFWCKSSNYELDARVPLIFSHPKLPKNKQVNSIVELIDVYPTIIDVCNIQGQTPLFGKSMVQLMEGNTKNWKNYAFNQFGRPYLGGVFGKGLKHMGYSVRSDQYRLTLWFNSENGRIDERELYDMSTGIEIDNISGNMEYKEIEEKLTSLLINFKNKKYK
jgi:iduronate 2-sulfatase